YPTTEFALNHPLFHYCGDLITFPPSSRKSFRIKNALDEMPKTSRRYFCPCVTLHRPGNGSAPASLLNNSTTLASRGSSRTTFSNASAASGDGVSPESFWYSFM